MPFKDKATEREYRKAYRQLRKQDFKEYDQHYQVTHREELNAYKKKYYLINREQVLANHRVNRSSIKETALIRKYGIDRNSYEQMLKDQGNVCKICRGDQWGGRWNIPYVDHDHTTGRVRGILCLKCNTAIGYLKDSANIAYAAASYLRGVDL
jgi:hypothetical protein